ncbi:MmgE/PrpD family protein [Paenalcaligenes sp. Me131]|uniref:MmgE/PrpD family protein n=1 Tax=Paenalcaligenes sp. Me131 TaxID=3392636 RepID=UPI003D266889
MTTLHYSRQLAEFAANLRYEDIPAEVIERTQALFLDTLASILAGAATRPVQTIETVSKHMRPDHGPSEVLVSATHSSPFFAAMINAAAAHVVEQDDLHNSSVLHPAAVVFPPALAVTQDLKKSGKDLLTAAVAGYEVGIRVGEFLGRSHYQIFHTTATVGTLAAAATAGNLLRLDNEQMLHAFGSAGTQAAGLWEFLRDAADSKQLHTAHAASSGLWSAYLAQAGFTGASQILEGKKGMAAGMSSDSDVTRLVDGLGTRWALSETSFKFHASCRHTHPSADALLQVMREHNLAVSDIEQVTTHVHQGAIDVLGAVTNPQTVHQSKFSMGTVLALVALFGKADLTTFDQQALQNPAVADFRDRVQMTLDEEVDSAYPRRWIGKVSVRTTDGRTLQTRVDEPKGDPGNTLTRDELEDKVRRLIEYGNPTQSTEGNTALATKLIDLVWRLPELDQVSLL